MHICLINPNAYQDPPVIPLGLEYITSTLRASGYDVSVLDLCFSEDPVGILKNWLENNSCALIGITVRNVDTVLYQNNEFFLDQIRDIVILIKEYSIPIVLGGSGFSISPYEILRYCGADYGIYGPGERAFVYLADKLSCGSILYADKMNSDLLNGWEFGFDANIVIERGVDLDYQKYLDHGGIIGFETQKGCCNTCSYCVEANKPLIVKDPVKVVQELKMLVQRGYHTFHLCDSEFNLDLSSCELFLKELITQDLDMNWVLYMVPYPYSPELFQFLKQSKASLITFSVCSDPREQQRVGYSFQDLEIVIALCQYNEIKVAIDLLIGFPGESIESITQTINFFKQHRPDSVGINFYFRLYKRTQMGNLIQQNPDKFKGSISRPISIGDDFLLPIFYNQFSMRQIQTIIGDDILFKIEGFEKTVNYQRI